MSEHRMDGPLSGNFRPMENLLEAPGLNPTRITPIDVRDNLPHTGVWPSRPLADITAIIHHQSMGMLTARGIAHYHQNVDPRGTPYGRGWPAIAYHLVVEQDGRVYWCLPWEARSYHSGGEANHYGVGVCWAGNFPGPGYQVAYSGLTLGHPTAQQAAVFRAVNDLLRETLNVQRTEVYGHCDQGKKKPACPGDEMMALVSSYRGW